MLCFVGGFAWKLTEFIIGVFLQVLGLPFVAVAQVSLFSKVTAEKTQGEEWNCLGLDPVLSGNMDECEHPEPVFYLAQVSVRECDAQWVDWRPSWALSGLEA